MATPRSGPAPAGSPRPGKRKTWKLAPDELASTFSAPVVQTAAERERLASQNLGLRHSRASAALLDCLIYPLLDGPGVAMLLIVPLFLWIMSIPVFDAIEALAAQGLHRGEFNALALMVLPFTMPLIVSFGILVGYVVLYLGHVLVASAAGEDDHPSWPELDANRMAEGLGRWLWALAFGMAPAILPAWLVAREPSPTDPFGHQVLVAILLGLGLAYGLMAMIAALVHSNLAAAHPITIVRALLRIGLPYLYPWLVSAVALGLAVTGLAFVLFSSPTMGAAAASLWLFWVFALYEALVVMRLLGLTYFHHASRLNWFRTRPAWASTTRTGRIYSNS